MARMTMTKAMKHYAPTFEETFERFLSNRKAKGSSDKTLQTYHYHFRAICKYLDADRDIDLITKTDLEQMLADMRDGGLSSNSINSYTRTLKSFFSWCNEEEITTLNLRLYKAEETVKDTYTDAELQADNFQLIKSAAQILRRDNQRIAFRETQTIYIENSLKSYDFSGFSGRVTGFEPAASWSQTGTENFFRTFLTVFYRFRSYSVTLVTSLEPPFPPVPRVSVVIHVVKNASRSKEREAFSMFKVSAL